MEDLEEYEGEDHPVLKERKVEIEKLDNEGVTWIDDSSGGNKEPLLTRKERLMSMGHQIEAVRSWKDWETQPRGKKRMYVDSVDGANQPMIGALGSTDPGRNSPRKEETPTAEPHEKREETEEAHVPK